MHFLTPGEWQTWCRELDSHEEFCYFASRDADVAERVAANFAKK